jgi:hypothetical protein
MKTRNQLNLPKTGGYSQFLPVLAITALPGIITGFWTPPEGEVAVIPLGLPLLTDSSDLPGSKAGRAAPPPLFGLAPRGVCPATPVARSAVRFYRTISPLPAFPRAVYFLWHFP